MIGTVFITPTPKRSEISWPYATFLHANFANPQQFDTMRIAHGAGSPGILQRNDFLEAYPAAHCTGTYEFQSIRVLAVGMWMIADAAPPAAVATCNPVLFWPVQSSA